MRRPLAILLVSLLPALLAASYPPPAAAQSATPLFAVGIDGGFTGALMRATVYRDGTVAIVRSGAGRPERRESRTVPLSVAAVRAAVRLARQRHVFAIPLSAQNATIGADIPVLSLTVYGTAGALSVHAMGLDRSHPAGTGKFFPIWGIFYALAGYPSQVL